MIRLKATNYRVVSSSVNDKVVDKNRINLNIVLHGQDEPESSSGLEFFDVAVNYWNLSLN